VTPIVQVVIPPIDFTLFSTILLTRKDIVKLLLKPYFEEAIRECFVRV